MKQNKVIPAWSQARIEIDEELERLRHRAWLAGRTAQLQTLPADRILERYNAIVPAESRRLLPLSAAALPGAEPA